MGWRPLAAAAAAVAWSAAGLAQDEPEGPGPDITGEWAFEAAPINPACRFWGEASIERGPEPGVYVCQLVANDVCPLLYSYQATQSCVARREGDQLVIESRVQRVHPPSEAYLPDDFELTIIDGTLMTGQLHSAYSGEAEFRRADVPIG